MEPHRSEHHLDHQTRFRIREFFHQTIRLRRLELQKKLLSQLSPAMQAEISYTVNSQWIERVWYLRSASKDGFSRTSDGTSTSDLRIELAARLSPFVFPPGEFCPSGFMYAASANAASWTLCFC